MTMEPARKDAFLSAGRRGSTNPSWNAELNDAFDLWNGLPSSFLWPWYTIEEIELYTCVYRYICIKIPKHHRIAIDIESYS